MGSCCNSFGDPPDGGPDQRCGDVVANTGSLNFAQTGELAPGDLIRWRVLGDLWPVDFEIHPAPGKRLPVYDESPVIGVAGRTKQMQVRCPDPALDGDPDRSGAVRFEFEVRLAGRSLGSGHVMVHLVRRRRPPKVGP